jgi:MFS transporter, DHA1 family, inner membrane transport protein
MSDLADGSTTGSTTGTAPGGAPPPPPSPPAARGVWLTIGILSLGTFATGTDAFITTGVLPRISSGIHVSLGGVGQLVTIFAWVYGIGSPVLMTLTGRVPRRLLLSGAMLLFGLVNFAVLLADSFASLAAIRVLAACFAATYVPAAAAAAAMLAPPEKRGRALAMVIGGSSLATALGVPIGIWIAESFDSWRAAFVFVGLLSVAAFIGVFTVLPKVPSPPQVRLSQRLAVLKQWPVLSILLTTGLAMTGGFTVFTYLAPILSGVAPYSGGRLQWLIFAFGVASILGSWLAGYGSDRWGANRVVAVALVILVANLALFRFSTETLVGAFAAMAVWGVAGWGFLPAQQHRLVRLAPTAPSIVISLNSSALYIGIALGSSLGGWLVGHYATDTLSWWAAAIDLGALALSLAVAAFSRRPAPAAP